MDCTEARDRLLQAAEGELPQHERPALDEHLAQCDSCRAEFDDLRRASDALRMAALELAPRRSYLTVQRLDRLTEAYAGGPRIFRLATYRQFVTAAAAVAIVVAMASIVWNMTHRRRPDMPLMVEGRARPAYFPVVLAAAGQHEPMNVVRSLPARAELRPIWDSARRVARVVETDSARVRVPVDHVFYDPEEAARWW